MAVNKGLRRGTILCDVLDRGQFKSLCVLKSFPSVGLSELQFGVGVVKRGCRKKVVDRSLRQRVVSGQSATAPLAESTQEHILPFCSSFLYESSGQQWRRIRRGFRACRMLCRRYRTVCHMSLYSCLWKADNILQVSKARSKRDRS